MLAPDDYVNQMSADDRGEHGQDKPLTRRARRRSRANFQTLC